MSHGTKDMKMTIQKNLVNFALTLSLMVGGVSLAFVPAAISQTNPQNNLQNNLQNRPLAPDLVAQVPHNCGSTSVLESFITNNYRVDICQSQNQLFLIAKENNNNEVFRSNTRRRGNNSYIAHGQNGISYFVDQFGLTVQINGRTVVQESIVRTN
jgi:hypothetical protein